MGARRWNHSDWTTITKWSVETWFSNEIDNLKNSRATLPAIVVVDDIFCRLSSGSPSPSESARLGEWGKSMEEWESSGIKQQNRQTEIKLLINFKLVQTDAGKSDFKIFWRQHLCCTSVYTRVLQRSFNLWRPVQNSASYSSQSTPLTDSDVCPS